MEEAEHAWFRTIGLRIVEHRSDGSVLGWPRVRASCSFEAPAFYDDLLDIDVEVVRRGRKSLTLEFQFHREGELLATGELVTVCCLLLGKGVFEPIEIPAAVLEKIPGPDE
jgi:acyl-CoA thioesterase FadM